MTKPAALLRALGLGDATMLVIGCIVGVGIFRTASSIATHLPFPSLILALWALGGVVSLCGGLCYAELAALFPISGGDYIYVRELYGRFWGFLFGWSKLFIERTGTIAILGFVFAEYLYRVVAYPQRSLRLVAASAIFLLTAVNVRGVRWGKNVQNTFAVLKIAALGVLIVVGLLPGAGSHAASSWSAPVLDGALLQSVGVAFVFVLWTFGGWTEAAYVAEEVRHPTHNVPRAMIGGILLTTVLYVLVNWSYLRYVTVEELPQTKLVAATVMQRGLGLWGAVFIAWMVACSAFGALNGYILTGGRILYALGKDHALFAKLGNVHATFQTPARALWANALIAIGLVFTKSFEQIVTYSTAVISLFFIMTVLGVITLRRRRPEAHRPYRAWGYPATPILFCLVMTGFLIDLCLKEPRECAFGFALLAAGVPLYWWSVRSQRRRASRG